jgi:hypothetical protein
VLCDTASFSVASNHVAGCVLKKQQRNFSLLAKLNKVSGFLSAFTKNYSIISDNADGMTPKPAPATGDGITPIRFKLGVFRSIN